MVWQLECDCKDRTEIVIDSLKLFKELETFFEEQVQNKIFVEETPKKPYYIWRDKDNKKEWFATKWYRCNICGCLWEFNYPDFPTKGFVRRFPNGIYEERGY